MRVEMKIEIAIDAINLNQALNHDKLELSNSPDTGELIHIELPDGMLISVDAEELCNACMLIVSASPPSGQKENVVLLEQMKAEIAAGRNK